MPKHDPHQKAKKGQGLWWVIGAAVVAAVAMIGVAVMSAKPEVEPTKTPAASADASMNAERTTWGNKSAKVELVEYGDYL